MPLGGESQAVVWQGFRGSHATSLGKGHIIRFLSSQYRSTAHCSAHHAPNFHEAFLLLLTPLNGASREQVRTCGHQITAMVQIYAGAWILSSGIDTRLPLQAGLVLLNLEDASVRNQP